MAMMSHRVLLLLALFFLICRVEPFKVLRETTLQCDRHAKYRSFDGTCNNLKHPLWGSVGRPYLRLLPPDYDDGVQLPRTKQRNHQPLPSSRQVSQEVFSSKCRVVGKASLLFVAWGQFLAHDIAGTPLDEVNKKQGCCDGVDLRANTHPDVAKGGPCFPIPIPPDDCHFPNTSCMPLVRSLAVTDRKGVRQQVNKLSAYIDGSAIYGADLLQVKTLREFTGGRLKEGRRGFLPKSNLECVRESRKDYCMMAGDDRVNIYPPLGALHTIFLRYHNYIAGELAKVHPDYDDDTLFQEARKIVVAVVQRITHREFLPRLLRTSRKASNLLFGNWTYWKRCDATMYNVIPTAALRFGHSMVPDYLTVDCNKVGLSDMFLRPNLVLTHLDSVISKSATERAMTVDTWISPGMMNRLLETDKVRGKDMVSINIQRGRDHGIAPYNHWRKLCGLRPLTNFSLLQQKARGFDKVYNDVDDVDLFTGAVAEKRVGVVGKTFTCLLARQFEKLRFCDRFWWENPDPHIGFACDKLRDEIGKTKLSHVICRTTGVYEIQRNVFKVPNKQRGRARLCHRILEDALNPHHF